MKIPRTDLRERLVRLRDRQVSESQLMQEVFHALQTEPTSLKRIRATLSGGSEEDGNALNFELLQTSRIFHLEQIRKICIDYRLRFLDAKYFKGKLPPAALLEIEQLEKAHDTAIKGYKIMAPSRLFKLEDKDDPLLFMPIGNGYYYLVYQWGNDLHPLRRILVWPFKSLVNLTILVLLISYLATWLVPDGVFSRTNTTAEFWLIFFFMFKSIGAVVIFYGFALGKNFNPAIWNSKYYNS